MSTVAFTDPKYKPLTQTELKAVVPALSGIWDYASGVSGTVTIPALRRVLQIAVSAPAGTAASFTINGGSSIIVPAGKNACIEPKGNLVAPVLVFTGTDSYFVESIL